MREQLVRVLRRREVETRSYVEAAVQELRADDATKSEQAPSRDRSAGGGGAGDLVAVNARLAVRGTEEHLRVHCARRAIVIGVAERDRATLGQRLPDHVVDDHVAWTTP
jgi:hypothetical protein